MIPVAVSACLLGREVRYDGTSKASAAVIALADAFELWPVCPEMELGLGAPRPPMQLRRGGDRGPRLVVIEDGRDLTAAMRALARSRVNELAERVCGFVLKSRSPSCGLGSVPIWSEAATVIDAGAGLFAAAVVELFPAMPRLDEEELLKPGARQQFEQAVRAFHASRLGG